MVTLPHRGGTSSSSASPLSRGRTGTRERERERDRPRDGSRDRERDKDPKEPKEPKDKDTGTRKKRSLPAPRYPSNSSSPASSSCAIPSPSPFAPSSASSGHSPFMVRVVQNLVVSLALIFVSFYLSVCLEEAARQLANSPSSMVPQRARAIINFVGTGKMGTQTVVLQQHQLIAGISPVPALKDWMRLPPSVVRERIPVVIVTSHIPNDKFHPALVAIRQARKLNEEVWVLGPNPGLKHLRALGVHIESRFGYNLTFNWLQSHLGIAKIEFARLWFLRAFMHRHKVQRVFSISADVMLYANITELVACLYPDTRVALPVRWPSMQPPPLPSQFTSTSVSAHAGLWHIDALDDFLQLYEVIIDLALFGGPRGAPVGRKEYQENIILGWYTWSRCWTDRHLEPPCMAEPTVGISQKLGKWLWRKTAYRPKFLVESLCQPRLCKNSSWSDEGLCVVDNSFSLATSTKFFKFRPAQGDKCPQSKLYEHFHAWMGHTPQKNVQFLAVNFQGTKRDFLKLEDADPAKTWGSAVF